MQVSFTFAGELRRLKRGLNRLERELLPRATSKGINDTLRGAASETVREAAAATGVPSYIVKERIRVYRARWQRLDGWIFVGTRPIPVKGRTGRSRLRYDLATGQREIIRKGVRTLTKARRRSKREAARGGISAAGRRWPVGFSARMENGHENYFQRQGGPGSPRLPITKLEISIYAKVHRIPGRQIDKRRPELVKRIRRDLAYRAAKAKQR